MRAFCPRFAVHGLDCYCVWPGAKPRPTGGGYRRRDHLAHLVPLARSCNGTNASLNREWIQPAC